MTRMVKRLKSSCRLLGGGERVSAPIATEFLSIPVLWEIHGLNPLLKGKGSGVRKAETARRGGCNQPSAEKAVRGEDADGPSLESVRDLDWDR